MPTKQILLKPNRSPRLICVGDVPPARQFFPEKAWFLADTRILTMVMIDKVVKMYCHDYMELQCFQIVTRNTRPGKE